MSAATMSPSEFEPNSYWITRGGEQIWIVKDPLRDEQSKPVCGVTRDGTLLRFHGDGSFRGECSEHDFDLMEEIVGGKGFSDEE